MADILFNCPHCGISVEAPDSLAGQEVSCPSCSQNFILPKPEPPPAPKLQLKKLCPSCGRALQSKAVATCEFCGFDLQAGTAPSTPSPKAAIPPPLTSIPPPKAEAQISGAESSKKQPSKDVITPSKVTIGEVLKTPFKSDVFFESIVLFLSFFGWMGLLFIAFLIINIMFSFMFATGGSVRIVSILAYVVISLFIFAKVLAWYMGRYFSIIAAYEKGAILMAGESRDWRTDLGHGLTVMIIAILPVVIAILWLGFELMKDVNLFALKQTFESMKDPATHPKIQEDLRLWFSSKIKTFPVFPVIGFLIGCGWSLFYWPMGIAMAGAYDILNPFRVLRGILISLPLYLLILIFLLIFTSVVGIVSMLIQHALIQFWSVLGIAAGWLIGLFLEFYALVCMFAVLGQLLRKYSHRLRPNE